MNMNMNQCEVETLIYRYLLMISLKIKSFCEIGLQKCMMTISVELARLATIPHLQ